VPPASWRLGASGGPGWMEALPTWAAEDTGLAGGLRVALQTGTGSAVDGRTRASQAATPAAADTATTASVPRMTQDLLVATGPPRVRQCRPG
jgi:hypothetical protein